MDIERFIVDGLTLYLMWTQTRIMQRQLAKDVPMDAQPVAAWRMRMAEFRRYWPLASMLVLAVAIWIQPYVITSPEKGSDTLLVVTISAAESPSNATLTVISNETFDDNSNVPLDGYVYRDCTFVNSCLMYDGGAYRLENATFKGHRKICVRSPRLKNLAQLMWDFDEIKPLFSPSKKTVIPYLANPEPSEP
jgi:hypothetical protein